MKNYINTSMLFVLLFSVTSEINAQQIVQIKSEETLRSEHFLKSIKPVSKSNSITAVYHEADLSSSNDFELSLTSIEHGSSQKRILSQELVNSDSGSQRQNLILCWWNP